MNVGRTIIVLKDAMSDAPAASVAIIGSEPAGLMVTGYSRRSDSSAMPMQIEALPGISSACFLLPRINRANVEQ